MSNVMKRTIRIDNGSVDTVVSGYLVAGESPGLLVWLEMPPQHHKTVGAVRAQMTANTRKYMMLRDYIQDRGFTVYGLGRGYLEFSSDAPQLAVGYGSKARMLRMVAPEAVRPQDVHKEFYVLEWPGLTPADALIATLEKYSTYPVLRGWGWYLLARLDERFLLTELYRGGVAPRGYLIEGGVPWGEIISEGVRKGHISLEGEVDYPPAAEFEAYYRTES